MRQLLVEQSLPGNAVGKTGKPTRTVLVNQAESPLAWLKSRGLVSERQFLAGERLRQDYERAALPQRTTMQWDATPSRKAARGAAFHGASTNSQLDAKTRFSGAVDRAGAGLSDILWRVICAGEAMPSAEKSLGWPTRAGRLVLTLALDRVADYYRIS